MVVVSNSISKGYYNNEAATQKSFFLNKDGRMGYKTGDLVYKSKGLIYFVGRKDFQVKLNGYRIELEDISENLNKIWFISNNVILPKRDEQGVVKNIAAFVTLKEQICESNMQTVVMIKKELKKLIPAYMIPKKIVILDKFPLNNNGKIDRKKLAEDL